jgi:hypothetical protein
VSTLIQTTEEQASENNHLKELVERLQKENESLKATGSNSSSSSSSPSSALAAAPRTSSSSPQFDTFPSFAIMSSTTAAVTDGMTMSTTTTTTDAAMTSAADVNFTSSFPFLTSSDPLSPSNFLNEPAATTPRGSHVNPLFDLSGPSSLFNDYRDTSYDLDDVLNVPGPSSEERIELATSGRDDFSEKVNAAFGGSAVAPMLSTNGKARFEVDEEALCTDLKDKAVCQEVSHLGLFLFSPFLCVIQSTCVF